MSQPVPVEWAGFQSDTYILGRMGWEFATEEDWRNFGLRVIMRHREFDLTGYGEMRDPGNLLANRSYEYASMMGDFPSARMLQADMQYRQQKIERHGKDVGTIVIHAMTGKGSSFIIRTQINLAKFDRMDPFPKYENVEEHDLHRHPLFAKLFQPEMQELIVAPEDVQHTLNLILKAQEGGMKDIRARERRRDRDEPEEKQVHAQIISLRAA